MKRIVTGVQSSGKLHIGNYFGSLKPNIELSEKYEAYLFIADLHALTTVRDPEALRQQTWDVALDFLACGLNPSKATFFRQSAVPAHSELSWILSNLTSLGMLERAHSFKDKKAKGIEVNAGLFTYPILMASDILLYDPDFVPVGKDQKQHVEMTRDIAQRFNSIYGEVFPVLPEPLISEETGIIPGTDGQKMSKSYGNTIPIFAPEKEIRKSVMGIVTDSKGAEEPKDPETCTVFQLCRLFFSAAELQELEEKYRTGGFGYGDAKKWLFEKIQAYFAPFAAKRKELAVEPEKIKTILRFGAEKAREMADEKIKQVHKMMGL